MNKINHLNNFTGRLQDKEIYTYCSSNDEENYPGLPLQNEKMKSLQLVDMKKTVNEDDDDNYDYTQFNQVADDLNNRIKRLLNK